MWSPRHWPAGASLPSGSDDHPTSSRGPLTPAWWVHWDTSLLLLKGERSHPDFTGIRVTDFRHSLARMKWSLSQSCLASSFVHFLVLWLEKASSPHHPKPTPTSAGFSGLPGSSASHLGHAWQKENPSYSPTYHYSRPRVYVSPCLHSGIILCLFTGNAHCFCCTLKE